MGQRRFVLSILTLTLLSLCLASPGFAQKKGKGGGKGGGGQSCKQGSVLPNPIPVTITLRDEPDDGIDDRITDDGDPSGYYGADANATIDCYGRVWMSSSWPESPEPGTERRITLDFTDGPPLPFEMHDNKVVLVPFSFKQSIYAEDQDIGSCEGISSAWEIPPTTSCRTRVNIGFDDPDGGKGSYAVRFNDNEPSSNDVWISRIDEITWSIESTDMDFANLVEYVRNRAVFTGPYVMPFRATVKCINKDCAP